MKYKCNECGSIMLDQSKGPYIHFVCPKCGNSLATYDYEKDDPVKFDTTIYAVRILGHNYSADSLKAISVVTGKNYLECKNIIDNNLLLLSGKAKDIIEKLKLLKNSKILVEINPAFPYEY